MVRSIIYFLALFIFCEYSVAQKVTKVQKAYLTYEAGEYLEAIDLLKDAYNRVNDKVEKTEIVFKIAECYRKTSESEKAELWYTKAIGRGFANPIAILHLAEAMMMNQKYEEAINEFQKYKSLVPDDPRGATGIESCELAMEWMANPSGYVVEEMKFFNSKNNDYGPAYLDAEYSRVVFTSAREGGKGSQIHGATGQGFADLFYSVVDRKGAWSEPLPLGETVNSEFEDGAPNIDTDFTTLYFTRCKVSKNKIFGCEIVSSSKEGEEWSEAKPLEIAGDSIVVAHPAISPDGFTLYFSSDMEGTLGGKDLWKVVRTTVGGEWENLENLGEQINTEGDEMFPFVHSDGTLYFSSNGHTGMGGLDIYRAKPKPDGTWQIDNMRYPVNSWADDFGICFERENERGFLSSNRNNRGDDDIFSFVLPPLRFNLIGVVKDEKTEDPLTNVTIRSISSDGSTIESQSQSDGSFKFMLTPNTDYVFIASREGYLNGKERETTKGLTLSKDFKSIIYLSSIEKPIELPNIFYDFGKWDLRPESMVSLEKLVETLADNPNIVIELGSHTDSRGSDAANQELSQKRAQSVVDFLIAKGIAPDRLVAKGYGESQPKVLDKKTAKQSRFFKEGDTLSEAFINTLSVVEQQEMAHQINRRTEFRVLRTDYVPKRK